MNKLSTLAFIAALTVAVPALAQTPADERNESAPAVGEHHENHMEADHHEMEHHKRMHREHREHHAARHHRKHEEHHDNQQTPPAGH